MQTGQIAVAFVPMLSLCATGAALTQRGFRPALNSLAPLASDLTVPCLVFTTLARTAVPGGTIGLLALAAGACVLLSALASLSVLVSCKLRLRVYLGPLTFPKSGSVGLPLSAAVFGPLGLTYASIFYVVSSVLNGMFGQALAAGRVNARTMLSLPLLHAAWLGLSAGTFREQIPQPLMEAVLATTGLAGQVALPLMLLMLGAALGELSLAALRRTAALGLARLVIGGAAGTVICWIFALLGVEGDVFVLQAAMPVGINSFLYAQRWDAQPAEVAGLVVCSTLEVFCFVPLALAGLS